MLPPCYRALLSPVFSVQLLLLATISSPLHTAQAAPAKSGAKSSAPAPKASKPAAKSKPAKAFPGDEKPYANGPGLLVGEPVLMGAGDGDDVLPFGAACSRWLQFNVGGQGEMGKTPLWREVESTRLELGRANLQLKPSDVAPFTKALGLTDVVLGEITTTAAGQYALKYQLLTVGGAKPAQSFPALTGTKKDIWKQLPAFALSLNGALGVKSAPVFPQGELSATEIDVMGRGNWTHSGDLTPKELSLLNEAAAQEPLAALLALEYTTHQGLETDWQFDYARRYQYGQTFCDSPLKSKTVADLMGKSSDNVLALAEISGLDLSQWAPLKKDSQDLKRVLSTAKKYEFNYAMRTTTGAINAQLAGSQYALESARHGILAAPNNPYAWLTLSERTSDQADSIRHGRVAGDLTVKEWGALGGLYLASQAAARRCVTLDPENRKGWLQLDIAATFNSDQTVSNAAFWKAYHLEPSNPLILTWGLEQFQPKWLGDPKTLNQVIQIASQPENLPYAGLYASQVLRRVGGAPAADALRDQTRAALEAEVAADPNDAQRWQRLAVFKMSVGENSSAEATHLTILLPNSALAFMMQAQAIRDTSRDTAIASTREALRLDPVMGTLHFTLANLLIGAGKPEEAVGELKEYLETHPTNLYGYVNLAWAYHDLGKRDLVIEASNKVLGIDPTYSDLTFYYHLNRAQIETGKFDDAVKSGAKALEVATTMQAGKPVIVGEGPAFKIAWGHSIYAWALFKRGQLGPAEAQCDEALKLDETNAGAHYCLAEIHLARGQKGAAQTEWQNVIDNRGKQHEEPLSGDYYADLARGRMKEYPVAAIDNL